MNLNAIYAVLVDLFLFIAPIVEVATLPMVIVVLCVIDISIVLMKFLVVVKNVEV